MSKPSREYRKMKHREIVRKDKNNFKKNKKPNPKLTIWDCINH